MTISRVGTLMGFLALALTAGACAGHRRYTLIIARGTTAKVKLPVLDRPVRVEVSASLHNGATQTPSALMSAQVNEDSSSQQCTFVGTNSDGTQSAGTTLSTTTVANIGGGNIVMSCDNISRELGFFVDPNRIFLIETIYVTLWY